MTRLAVIDRHGYYLEILKDLFDHQPDFEVVAAVSIYQDFVEHAKEAEIAVVQQEPEIGTTRQVIQAIHEHLPNTRVVVIGVPDDPSVILQYIEAGAKGYVRETETRENVLNVIRIVVAGESIVHPELVRPLFDRLAQLGKVAHELSPTGQADVHLTKRQEEIAELLAQELTNEEIAERLYISVGTVKNHVHAILETLGVSSRQQAALIIRHLRDTSLTEEQKEQVEA